MCRAQATFIGVFGHAHAKQANAIGCDERVGVEHIGQGFVEHWAVECTRYQRGGWKRNGLNFLVRYAQRRVQVGVGVGVDGNDIAARPGE